MIAITKIFEYTKFQEKSRIFKMVDEFLFCDDGILSRDFLKSTGFREIEYKLFVIVAANSRFTE